MKFLGKFTRILSKTILFLIVFLLLALLAFYFVAQTEKFQTWAAQKAAKFLSEELGTKVEVEKEIGRAHV